MLEIDEVYYLDSDKYNIILCRKKVKENGEEIFKKISFHRNIEDALRKYIENKTKEKLNTNKTAEQLLKEIENLKKFLETYLENNIEHLKLLKTKYNAKIEDENKNYSRKEKNDVCTKER